MRKALRRTPAEPGQARMPVPADELARGTRFGGICAGCCCSHFHRRLVGLGGSGRAVGSGGARSAGLRDFEFLAQGVFELVANVLVFLEEDAGVFAALAHALASVAEPRAALLDDALVDSEIEEVALAGDPFAVDDVEFGLAEGRGDFVLDDFGASA